MKKSVSQIFTGQTLKENLQVFERPENRWVLFLVSIWFGVTAILVLLGFADGELVCDDAYYYFEITRNAALGSGFTFDSLYPTNGFHPLWAWMLVPIFYLFPYSVWIPIHISLLLSAGFTAATALCIYVFFSRYGRHMAGFFGAVVWLLNPFTIVLSFRGLEGPLNTFLIALVFLYLDTIRVRATYTAWQAIRFGILVGLCLLARTDNVLLLAAVSIILSIELGRKSWRDLVGKGALFALVVGVVLSPWLVWNLLTFGTVVQTSFQAKQMFNLYGQLPSLVSGELSGPGDYLQIIPNAFENLFLIAKYNAKFMMGEEWAQMHKGYLLLYPLLFLGVGLALLPNISRRIRTIFNDQYQSPAGSLAPIGLFCLIHFGWYGLVSQNYYNWYFLPPVLAFSLFAGKRLGWFWSLSIPTVRECVSILFALLLVTTPLIVRLHVSGLERHQDEAWYLENAMKRIEKFPAGSKLGVWNAGEIGYFSSFHNPDVYIVNLDGLVNNEVTRYAINISYEQYLLDHVDFLIESPHFMTGMIGEERARKFINQHGGMRHRIKPLVQEKAPAPPGKTP